jgi:NTP pyrophosphatase (non-canonical NTP hydrolase)
MRTPPENVHPYHLNQREREQFLELFHAVGLCAFEVNYANGWWEQRLNAIDATREIAPTIYIGCLGLVTSEVAEAMEAVRKHDPKTWGDWQSKDTLVRELAGTIVRVMDLAHHLNLPLGDALLAEIEANAKRGFMHGGKKA